MAGDEIARTAGTLGAQRRAAASACAWCGGPIAVRSRGPIPKWCSTGCRREAWTHAHAAESGRSAVTVVERIVHAPSLPPPQPRAPRHGEWTEALRELARQLDTGRLYDRDLSSLAEALEGVVAAFDRRARFRRR